MSEPKWTPGPWSYGFPTAETALGKNDYEDWGTIRDANGWPLARVNTSRFEETELALFRKRREDPVAAEARLIAAAPELAEALENLLHWAEPRMKRDPTVPPSACDRALAALAKAKGGD